MNAGEYSLEDGMSMSSFLKANGVLHFAETNQGLKRRYGRDRTCIVVSAPGEEKAVGALLSRFSGPCAFMLFNELNGFMSVIRC